MTDVQEPLTQPLRWLDDPEASAALRADLAQGATATVTGIDYGATLTALRGAIASQTAPLLPVAAAAGSSGWSVGAKLAIGVLLVGGIAVWASSGDVEDASKHASIRSELEPSSQSERALQPEPTPAPAVRRSGVAPEPAPALRDAPVVPAPQPAVAVPTDAVPTSDAPPTDADRDRGAKTRKRTTDGGTQDTAVTPAITPVDPPAEDTSDDAYLREAKLVAQARRALAGDPDRALALTGQVEREFPNGMLGEERRAIEIRALAALGKSSEAKRAAKAFLAEYPDGPQAAAVRRAIED